MPKHRQGIIWTSRIHWVTCPAGKGRGSRGGGEGVSTTFRQSTREKHIKKLTFKSALFSSFFSFLFSFLREYDINPDLLNSSSILKDRGVPQG